jgi:hypothetical protein
MKKLILLAVITLLCGFSTDTFAQKRNRGYNTDRSTYNDRARIRRGVRSGRITRDEARDLRNRERELRRERRSYRQDGLTREERREIRRDERQADRRIRREVRDDDRRSGYRGRMNQRRGNGYYRRGAGSSRHPVFGSRN